MIKRNQKWPAQDNNKKPLSLKKRLIEAGDPESHPLLAFNYQSD